MKRRGIAHFAARAARKMAGQAGSPERADLRLLVQSELFDRDFYLSTYPDVAESGMDPVEHYVRFGANERRNPSSGFDTSHYLDSNQDVEQSGVNPLLHFLKYGASEGRTPLPPPGTAPNSRADVDSVVDTIRASGCFDEVFYLSQVPDAVSADSDVLRHYVEAGASKKKNPCQWFDTGFYLLTYKDVAESGINPFYHFLEFGWRELRSPSKEVDAAWLFLFNEDLRSGEAGIPQFLGENWLRGSLSNRKLGNYSPNEKVKLVNAIASFLEKGDGDHRTLYALGKLAVAIGASNKARKIFVLALEKNPDHYRYLDALSELSRELGRWPEHLALLERILGILPDSALHLQKVGTTKHRLGDLAGAREALERSLSIRLSEETAYRLGVVCEDQGYPDEAARAFATALGLAKIVRGAKLLGPGVLHRAREDHVRAARAFADRLASDPLNAELHYRLGFSYERLYRWEDAGEAYRRAISLGQGYGKAAWHFRIGFVNERMQRPRQAIAAYRAAISLSPGRMREWEFRLGRVLESVSEYQAAAEATLGMSPVGMEPIAAMAGSEGASRIPAAAGLDEYFRQFADESLVTELFSRALGPPASHVYRELMAIGEVRERQADWVGAGRAYEAAAARDDKQGPAPYEKAGRAFLLAGMPREASRALGQTRLLRRPYGVGVAAVESSRVALLSAAYLEYMNDYPILDQVVMYESFSGLSMACNPLAIFRQLLVDPEFSGFTHVWVVNDRGRVPEEFARREDVVFVSRDSMAYVKYLATAKFLINNSGFPGYFIRRPGQKYLATWHGTPLKTLGKEQKYKFYDHKRTQRNFLHATHIISPNAHTTRVQLDSYDIRPLYRGLFAETGYPRIDLTLNASPETRAKLRARLSLDGERKVVLYAPTWRGTPDEVRFDFEQVQNDLEELAKLDCQVIFRGHSWLERAINAAHVHCNVVPADIDTNELLSIVDVLVTDYSSVFFDFFATGKPVVYYIYDLEEYTRDRGLYFDMDDLPGIKCRNVNELRKGVRHALTLGVDHERYDGEFNRHDDGGATKRVVDFFFKDDASQILALPQPGRTRVLVYAGTFEEGRQSRLAIEFAKLLDPERYEVVFTFTPSAVEMTVGGMDRFRMLLPGIVGLPRYGNVLMTPEERWLRKRYEEGRLTLAPECIEIVKGVYERELYRMMCDIDIHAVVVFDGASAFWSKLLLDGRSDCRRIRISEHANWEGLAPGVIDVSYETVVHQGAAALVSLIDVEYE